jgi:mannose-1-phosphate guanylyltransferase
MCSLTSEAIRIMMKAFVLGAGLGERLRPLTEQLPKPLVPLLHRPLITWAFQHMATQLGVQEFVVNTWHLAEAYERAFPTGQWQGHPLHFRKDAPILLDTAGGMANVRDLLAGEEPFIVYNGDVLADFDLRVLRAAHERSGHMVTLGLRSSGPALAISYDADKQCVVDLRSRLGHAGTHLFTGVYIAQPEFLSWLTPGVKESVVEVFLRLLQAGHSIGGCVLDEGQWWDLGSRRSYLDLHAAALTAPESMPAYLSPADRLALHEANPAIHATAQLAPTAQLLGQNCIGPDCVVAADAILEDCVLWPGARVAAGVRLQRCILRSDVTATESGVERDY